MRVVSFFIIILNYIFSQSYVRDINPFPIVIDGEAIEAPFTGGLNQPDPRFIDWNEDGILDCFVNDRDGYLQYWEGVAVTMEDSGIYVPKFELMTKSFQGINVGTWYAFHDFDGDGDMDLLSHTPDTDHVSYWSNENHIFIRITDELMDIDQWPVYGGQIVIPAIADINNDGYIDYFVGDIAGRVAYYEGHEFLGGLPQFKFITNSFEDIWIVWTPGRHGANAFEFYDLDHDSDLDLIWGDFYQPGLFYLENYGTISNPVFDDSLLVDDFPSELDFATTGHNIARIVDFDGDGDGDMVVGVLTGAYGIDYLNNLYYFQNNGTAESWNFSFVTSRLLPGLDYISGTHPAVSMDCNQNLVKLWIGTEFNPDNNAWSGGLYQLNEKTDFFSGTMNSLFHIGSNLSPGVLNQLVNNDLFIGDFNGTIFRVNESVLPEDSCALSSPKPNFLNIDLSGRATPSFGDIDQDGDNDFVIGDKDGVVHIYWNRGDEESAIFDTASYLSIDIGENASPCVLENGHILAGNKEGQLYELIYWDSEELIAELRSDIPYIGRNLSPAALYHEGQSEPDLIFGTLSGGLQYFRYDTTTVGIKDNDYPIRFKLNAPYPNPFNNHFSFSISMESEEFIEISVVNILGQHVQDIYSGLLDSGVKNWNITTTFPSGIYFLWVHSNFHSQIRKILQIK